MDIYRTEEEQVAALKKWWASNGKSLIIGIILALSLVFGWKSWQQRVLDEKDAASMLYQQLLQASMAEPMTEESRSSVRYMAGKLKTDFDDTQYGVFAALYLAREAVVANELAAAETELNWALTHAISPELKAIVTIRLAKVLAALGRHDEGIKRLDGQMANTFLSLADEAKGDIYMEKDDKNAAREAYIRAYKGSDETPGRRELLRIKLSSLGVFAEDL